MGELIVVPFRHGPFWNFSYLLGCAESREAAVIDPAWSADAILREAERRDLSVRMVLLTHTHADHVNGLSEVVGPTAARVVVHRSEVSELPVVDGAGFESFSDGESVELGRHRIRTLHVPGHSPGSAAFLVDGELFVGDTLHVGGVGRPGPDRDAVASLWESCRRLATLPASTVMWPGHDEGPTRHGLLSEQFERVSALRAGNLEEFVVALERATGRSHRHE